MSNKKNKKASHNPPLPSTPRPPHQIEALPLGQKDFTQSALGVLRSLIEGGPKRAPLVPARVAAAAGVAGAGSGGGAGPGGSRAASSGGGGGVGALYSMLMDFNDNDFVSWGFERV
jgi:hypothetical protein